MNTYLRSMLVATGVALSLAAIHVNAAVTVSFTKPDAYTDIGFSSWDKDKVMKDLSQHLDFQILTLRQLCAQFVEVLA